VSSVFLYPDGVKGNVTLRKDLGTIGSVTSTLAAATVSSTATVDVAGTLASSLAAATVASTATVAVAGTLTQTLGAATVASTATVAVAGTLTQTLGAATVASTGIIPVTGTTTRTNQDASLSSSIEIVSQGSAALLLSGVSASITGEIPVVGNCDRTGDAATVTASGNLPITATVAKTLADTTVFSEGEILLGTLYTTLSDATCNTNTAVLVQGNYNKTTTYAVLTATGKVETSCTLVVTLGGCLAQSSNYVHDIQKLVYTEIVDNPASSVALQNDSAAICAMIQQSVADIGITVSDTVTLVELGNPSVELTS
jgi:hypothetical protein